MVIDTSRRLIRDTVAVDPNLKKEEIIQVRIKEITSRRA
jgi:hypothetical protein